jgi:WD40 repeat protein
MSRLQLWDAKTFQGIGEALEHPHLRRARFDVTGKTLLTIGCLEGPAPAWRIEEGEARLWDVATQRLTRRFTHEGRALSEADLSHDGSMVATCSHKDDTVRVYEASTGKLIESLPHGEPVRTLQEFLIRYHQAHNEAAKRSRIRSVRRRR